LLSAELNFLPEFLWYSILALTATIAVSLLPYAAVLLLLFSATLDFLARFLSKVAGQEKTNRMNAKGLAVVLSPNLLRNPEGNPLVFKVSMIAPKLSWNPAYIRRHWGDTNS